MHLIAFLFLHSIFDCQVYSIVVDSPILYKVFPLTSNTHLAPYIVIAILLIIFPALSFTSPMYFVTTNLYFLIPSPFSPSPPNPTPVATIRLFSVSMSLSPFCLFILFFRFHNKVKSYRILFFVWLISLYIIPSKSIYAVSNDKISFFFMAE